MPASPDKDAARVDADAAHVIWPTTDANRGRPLEGTRVLDASRVLSGPYCAMVLADLGAEVVKVEPPAGDQTRRWGPPFAGESAAYYYGTNRNKRGVALDLASDEGRARLDALVREADVVLHNFPARTAAKLGLDYARVAGLNARVVHLAISGFGALAPERKGYDVIVQAGAGMMAITGEADGPPAKVGAPIADLAAALHGAAAVCAALAARARTGRGAQLEISLHDATLSLLANQAMSWLLCGEDTPRMGSEHPVIAPYGSYATGDGALVLGVGSDRQFAALCGVLGAPQLADDPRWRENGARVRHRDALRPALEQLLAARGAEAWAQLLDAAGVPCSPVRSVPEAISALPAGALTELPHGELGTVSQLVPPLRVDGAPLVPYLAPPALGEHTAELFAAAAGPQSTSTSHTFEEEGAHVHTQRH